jgi:NitT/TauT family transport system permease protein
MMPNKNMPIYRVLPLSFLLLLWEIAVRLNNKWIFFFGMPSKIETYFVIKMLNGTLPVDFAITFFEAATGFIMGNLFGILLGITLWQSRNIFLIARPYIIALGSAPIFALAPLFIIWFGTGIFSKIMIATFSTFFVALFQAHTGASEVKDEYISLMQTFGATKNQIFRKIIAPSSIVWVVSAFRMNVSFAILGAFIGEFISSNKGLGHLILVASGLFDISLVLCGIFMLMLMALIFNYIISISEAPLKKIVVKYL